METLQQRIAELLRRQPRWAIMLGEFAYAQFDKLWDEGGLLAVRASSPSGIACHASSLDCGNAGGAYRRGKKVSAAALVSEYKARYIRQRLNGKPLNPWPKKHPHFVWDAQARKQTAKAIAKAERAEAQLAQLIAKRDGRAGREHE